ncbi:hypothetical protein RI367_007183 [Sorochytrium milnesiophthora]
MAQQDPGDLLLLLRLLEHEPPPKLSSVDLSAELQRVRKDARGQPQLFTRVKPAIFDLIRTASHAPPWKNCKIMYHDQAQTITIRRFVPLAIHSDCTHAMLDTMIQELRRVDLYDLRNAVCEEGHEYRWHPGRGGLMQPDLGIYPHRVFVLGGVVQQGQGPSPTSQFQEVESSYGPTWVFEVATGDTHETVQRKANMWMIGAKNLCCAFFLNVGDPLFPFEDKTAVRHLKLSVAMRDTIGCAHVTVYDMTSSKGQAKPLVLPAWRLLGHTVKPEQADTEVCIDLALLKKSIMAYPSWNTSSRPPPARQNRSYSKSPAKLPTTSPIKARPVLTSPPRSAK